MVSITGTEEILPIQREYHGEIYIEVMKTSMTNFFLGKT